MVYLTRSQSDQIIRLQGVNVVSSAAIFNWNEMTGASFAVTILLANANMGLHSLYEAGPLLCPVATAWAYTVFVGVDLYVAELFGKLCIIKRYRAVQARTVLRSCIILSDIPFEEEVENFPCFVVIIVIIHYSLCCYENSCSLLQPDVLTPK